MSDIKQCIHCGATFTRPYGCSVVTWEGRRFCSRACAATWSGGKRPKCERPVETKVCPVCGVTFARHAAISAVNWARRVCCSQHCGGIQAHRNRVPGMRQLDSTCECGADAIDIVWIVQGSADGYLHRQCVEVCADCREMWLEDGATLEPPEVVNEPPKCQGPKYFAQAKMFHGNGRREW